MTTTTDQTVTRVFDARHPAIKEFLYARSMYVLGWGPGGTGKTAAGCLAMQEHAKMVLQTPGLGPSFWPIRGVIIRETRKVIGMTIAPELRYWYPQEYGMSKWHGREDEPERIDLFTKLYHPDGSPAEGGKVFQFGEYWCIGVDSATDLNKLAGMQVGFAWVDEPVSQIADSGGVSAETISSMVLRSRQVKLLRVQITFNPPGTENYVHTIWLSQDIDPTLPESQRRAIAAVRARSTVVFFPQGMNKSLEAVAPDYAERNAEILLAIGRPDMAARFVEGRAVTTQQGEPVTPEFISRHKVSVTYEPGKELLLAWDFGLHASCCPAGTRVLLQDGRVKPIESIQTGDVVMSVHGDPAAALAPGLVTGWQMTGIQRCLTIRTRHHEVRLTEDHPVLVLRATKVWERRGFEGGGGYRQLQWVPAGEVTVGDDVVTYRLPRTDGRVPTLESFGRDAPLMEDFGHPVTLEMAELMGAWIGDGTRLTKDSAAIDFSAYHGLMQAHWAKLATAVNGRRPTLYKGRVIINDRVMAQLWYAAGFQGYSHERRVPSWIFDLPVAHRLRFLRGYLDSDGTVTKQGSLRFFCVNESLIWDIWALCQSCGMQVNHVHTELFRNAYVRKATGDVKVVRAWGFSSHDPIWRLVGSTKWPDRLTAPSLARSTYRIPAGLDTERVNRIDRSEVAEPVYDIQVAGGESFFANGVAVHNCAVAQLRRTGQLGILAAFSAPNMGVAQLVERFVHPYLMELGLRVPSPESMARVMSGARDVWGEPLPLGAASGWADIGVYWRHIIDPQGVEREQSNAKERATLTLQRLLGGSIEPASQSWPDRREGLHEALSRPWGEQMWVQVDPSRALPLIQALEGGWYYRRLPNGQVQRDLPEQNSAWAHIGNAFAYLVERLLRRREARHALESARKRRAALRGVTRDLGGSVTHV